MTVQIPKRVADLIRADAPASAARTALGLGTAATHDASDFALAGSGGGGSGTPGGTTGSVQYNDGSSAFAGSSALTFTVATSTLAVAVVATTKVTTAGSSLVLEQTGDTFGTTRLSLENRTGLNGAIFENAGLDLVDFGFLTSTAKQGNVRWEGRSGSLVGAANTGGEFQMAGISGGTATIAMAVGVGQVVIAISAVRNAADDAAAAALSPAVPVGGLYRTGSTLKIRVS